jgi:aryl-alcohol dehydrogenase-like predicted oxidoreductase
MVSIASLGCGGGSRLGKSSGKSEQHSINIVRKAIDLGINFLDTANTYGTETIVGQAINALPRDQVVISTKHHGAWQGRIYTPEDVVSGLENSLRALKTDYVDIFHLHGVAPKYFDHAITIVPQLLKEKEKGKFRFLGITESAPADPTQISLSKALDLDCFDVIMLASSIMNHNAKKIIFPRAIEKNIGTMLMFVVRSLFSVPGRLRREVRELVANGLLPKWFSELENPLEFLIKEGGANSVMDACYRYARHQRGANTVLFGTGNLEHLEINLASILAPSLPEDCLNKIDEYFGHLEGVGLDFPGKK